MIGVNELIMIGALVGLLFGASKLPELFRNLGRAQVEFRKGQKEAELELRKLEQEMKDGEISKKHARAKLEEIARSLGIDSEGKSDEELIDEINKLLER